MKEYFSPHLGLVCLGVLVFSLYALALAQQPLPEIPAESVQVEGNYEN
tara:strand:- start:779 stop:922 length:144 start_codon:yes stop_codon:yes gene_type:complete